MQPVGRQSRTHCLGKFGLIYLPLSSEKTLRHSEGGAINAKTGHEGPFLTIIDSLTV